jgi:MFS family permease
MRRAFSVLGRPHVARVLFTSYVGRLPLTAVGLLLILRARELGLSYATSGLIVAVFGAAVGLSGPALGRVIDRRGQTRVLVVLALLAGCGFAGLALVTSSTPAGVIVAVSLATGLAIPPLSAVTRALWDDLLPGPAERHQILSLESALMELVFVLGPLLLVTGLASISVPLAIAAAGALTLVGALLFAAQPASRARRPVAAPQHRRGGALGSGAVRSLVGVMLAIGLSFGAIEVLCAAFAEDAGHRGAAGLLFGAWGIGSLAGGLVAARAGLPSDRGGRLRQLIWTLALLNAGTLLARQVGLLGASRAGLVTMGALLLLGGLAIAPTFALVYGLLGDLARAGTQTEAYGWLGAATNGGVAGGSALAGALIALIDDTGGALIVAAAATLLAAVLARAVRPAPAGF